MQSIPDDRRYLINPLRLEAKKGCDNSAVAGGIDKLIEARRAQFKWLPNLPPLKGGKYANLTPQQRREWVKAALWKLTQPPGTKAPQPLSPPTPKQAEQDSLALLESTFCEHKAVSGGIRAKLKSALDRLGLKTIRDVIWYVPRDYRDYTKALRLADIRSSKEAVTVKGRVNWIGVASGGRIARTEAHLSDGSATARLVWFGKRFIAKAVKAGDELIVSGKPTYSQGRFEFRGPEYEVVSSAGTSRQINAGGLVPVYSLPEKVTIRMVRYATHTALKIGLSHIKDWLPAQTLKRRSLMPLTQALQTIHYPESYEAARKARTRLAFDELFFYRLIIAINRATRVRRAEKLKIETNTDALNWFRERIGFKLTADQEKAIEAILANMRDGTPMARLLQGEVGSGKTVVALMAAVASAAQGYKAALLAPTEILAEQHFLNTARMLNAGFLPIAYEAVAEAECPFKADKKLRIALLVGKHSPKAMDLVRGLINNGEIDIIIGTHAIIQEKVEIPNQGLAIIDEQQRFGVSQRAAFTGGDSKIHTLTMSATPIPRTLHLSIYGDMDVSTLKQLPQGARHVTTELVLDDAQRERAYAKVREQSQLGKQTFIVCPFIDPSEAIPVRAAEQEYERLRHGELQDLSVGLLHGRTSFKEKQRVINLFKTGKIDVLVATPIIEVGVDIPAATVMLIESADRFGMAQLHQLRGRVGRAGDDSWCYLLVDDPAEDAVKRLEKVEQISDGFELANADLQLRGPGDYLGTRQSGWAKMRIASLFDYDILKEARLEATAILEEDPDLKKYTALKREMVRFRAERELEFS